MKFQEYRQEEWFIMHHRDNCTICGRPLIKGMNTYAGKTESNILAYVCEDCNNLLLSSHFYTNSPSEFDAVHISNRFYAIFSIHRDGY